MLALLLLPTIKQDVPVPEQPFRKSSHLACLRNILCMLACNVLNIRSRLLSKLCKQRLGSGSNLSALDARYPVKVARLARLAPTDLTGVGVVLRCLQVASQRSRVQFRESLCFVIPAGLIKCVQTQSSSLRVERVFYCSCCTGQHVFGWSYFHYRSCFSCHLCPNGLGSLSTSSGFSQMFLPHSMVSGS